MKISNGSKFLILCAVLSLTMIIIVSVIARNNTNIDDSNQVKKEEVLSNEIVANNTKTNTDDIVSNTEKKNIVIEIKENTSKEEIGKETISKYFNTDEIEEIVIKDLKFIPVEDIDLNNETDTSSAVKYYKLTSEDLLYTISYELKIKEGTNTVKYTAGNGIEDGNWIKSKGNCVIAKKIEDGKYKIIDFGTSF